MSGPKVVRIVTRQEVERICRQQLALFEQAAADFQSCAMRNGVWDSSCEETIRKRRSRLQSLFQNEQWLDVQKQGRLQTEFLTAEAKRLESSAIDRAQSERRKHRQLVDSARTIISALQQTGRAVPKELADLEADATRASLDELSRIVETAFRALRESEKTPESTKEMRELAARLGAGEAHISFAEWAASKQAGDAKDQRLDRLLAEVEVLQGGSAQGFAERISAISAEESANRRTLLTDSLILDVAAHVKMLRSHDAGISAMKEARAGLLGDSAEINSIRHQLDAAISEQRFIDADRLVAAARLAMSAETSAMAAIQRREAILEAFAALGYEVREGMATAWAQNGRIVVKKPGVADYAVELGTTTTAEQMQIRLVGARNPGEPRTTRRDQDMETQWCGDFTRLRELVSKRGGELSLERALPVGAQAVKTVDLGSVTEAYVERTRIPGALRRP